MGIQTDNRQAKLLNTHTFICMYIVHCVCICVCVCVS